MAGPGERLQRLFPRPVLSDSRRTEEAIVAVRLRRPEGLPRDRQDPLPLLPVLSAMSCSTQSPKGAISRGKDERELVPAPARHLSQEGPEKAPVHLPDFSVRKLPSSAAAARSRNPFRSIPIRAAGTRPKQERAE